MFSEMIRITVKIIFSLIVFKTLKNCICVSKIMEQRSTMYICMCFCVNKIERIEGFYSLRVDSF